MSHYNSNNDTTGGKQDPFEDNFSTENWNEQQNVTSSNYNPFRDNVNQQQYSPSNLIDTNDFIDLQQDPQSPTTSNFNTGPTAVTSAHLSSRDNKQKGIASFLGNTLLTIFL